MTDNAGAIVEKRHFDAWGNVLLVQDGQNNNLSQLTFLERGYTGHEHLQGVGLINMNARFSMPNCTAFWHQIILYRILVILNLLTVMVMCGTIH